MGRSLEPVGEATGGEQIGTDAGITFESKGVQYAVERREGQTVFSLALPVGAELEAEPVAVERLALGLAP